jgi:AcrR family transcriptional regulator
MAGADEEQQGLLREALAAFLEHGFHAVELGVLEAATGLAWSDLPRLYHDKEGLFLSAAEHGLRDGSIAGGQAQELLDMLKRLERANANPRLRAIHKQAMTHVRGLAEAATQQPD